MIRDDPRSAELDALVEEATLDANDEEEQALGLFTMLEEHLALPFVTTVLGVTVTVAEVDLGDRGQVNAICTRGPVMQPIPIAHLPLPTPPPRGADWIDAYRHWLREA